jgi:hypothetical protein
MRNTTRRRIYLGVLFLAAFPTTIMHSQTSPETIRPVGVFGTGHLSHSELLAPIGTAEGNFIYVSCPTDICVQGQAPFVTLNTQYPFPLWLPDTDEGQWIGPDAGGNENTTDPSGEYQYREIFDLTGFDLKTVHLYGAFACDNSCYIALNGKLTPFTSSTYSELAPFFIESGFKPGLNRLDFFATNEVQNIDNPTGLFVEMFGEGQHAD